MSKKYSTNYWRQKCIRIIVNAQRASDGGKGISQLGYNWATKKGYSVKPLLIAQALRIIDSHPHMGINYYVTSEPDQNGYGSVLVYFEIKENGERLQISFHNPHSLASELYPWINKGRTTRWNGEYGGSRRACSIIDQSL